MERYLRTDGFKLMAAHVAFATFSNNVFHSDGDSFSVADAASKLLMRFAGTSVALYYYRMTWSFWYNYLFYTSYTTFEFLRLVVMTFTVTCLHELFGGGTTNGKGWLPFPFESCAWTTKGIESWKVQDPAGYATAGSPEPGDFVESHHRYWGWKRPPMWHMIVSMDVFCTVSNPAQVHEYQSYCGKLNAGLAERVPKMIATARTVTSGSFKPGSTTDVSASATCKYKIFDVGTDLADRLHKAMEGGELVVGWKVDVALVDELMRVVCQHVSRGGKPISVDDCVAMHLNTGTAGPYIPVLHWDVEYGLFPEADGFNVWMLTSSDCSDGKEGNIYIVDSSKVTGADELPEWIAFTGDEKCGHLPAVSDYDSSKHGPRPAAVRRRHDLSFPERETGAYATVDELDMKFDYIAAKPGECVVWSKRTLHMSDPRPLLEKRTVKRKVIQIRVVLRPMDTSQKTLVFNPDHPTNFLLSGWSALRSMRQDFGGKSHVPIPGTYQLLQPFYNPTKAAAINDAAMQTQKKAA